MNASTIRLSLLGSRASWGRPLGVTCGIAVGVVLFLTLWGAASGLSRRDERTAWLNINDVFPSESARPIGSDEALAFESVEFFRSDAIRRFDFAVTDDTTAVTGWGSPLPAAGTYYASPALLDLIRSNPQDQLEARFGTFAGVIPDSALAGPDQLVVVVGLPMEAMLANQSAWVEDNLAGTTISSNDVYQSVIIIGGIALFLPVLLFVAIVTELGAAQRMERLATMRLIGAGPSSVVGLAALEMALLSLVGAVLGAVAWWLLRPIGATFSIDGTRFFTDDLNVGARTILLTLFLTILGATLTAAWQTGRAGIGPLGAARERMERTPSFLRLAPVLAGIGLTALGTMTWKSGQLDGRLVQILLLVGFSLTGLGIVIAGPWLTGVCSRLTMRRARSAAGIIAASRIKQHPVATFRAMSGLVLTIFVVSVFAGASSSVLDIDEAQSSPLLLSRSAVYVMVDPAHPVTDAELTRLQAIAGVTAATVAFTDADMWDLSIAYPAAEALGFDLGNGAAWYNTNGAILNLTVPTEYDWNPGPSNRPVGDAAAYVLVGTDGTAAAIDRVRTALPAILESSQPVMTRADLADRQSMQIVNSFSNLSYIGILVTTIIASIALTVATAAAMLERKRIFGLLRLMGMPTRTLQWIVAFEALVPLAAVVLLSAGIGWLIAWLIVDGLSYTRSIHMPDARYFGALAAGLLMAGISVLGTARLIRDNTTVAQTRFE